MNATDVTERVECQWPVQEDLLLRRCVCGATFPHMHLSADTCTRMPCCGALLYWTQPITVWQIGKPPDHPATGEDLGDAWDRLRARLLLRDR